MYQNVLRQALEAIGRSDIDPRWLEGSMRLQYGNLNHLAMADFVQEARVLEACLAEDPDYGESVADSFGL